MRLAARGSRLVRRGLAAFAVVLGLAAAGALVHAASSAGAPVRPATMPTPLTQRAAPAAAQAAAGRRVLVLEADPARTRRGTIYESGRAPEGWRLFPAAPPGASDLDAALRALAAAASDAFRPGVEFPADVAEALRLFAVKIVVADDGGKGAELMRPLDRADPVLRLDGGAPPANAADAVALARELRVTVARESAGWTFSDAEDELWGGSVAIDTKTAARFVLPYAARGGRVFVDGAPAVTASAVGPLLSLDLPAGRSVVRVRFVEPGAGEPYAIAGAAGIVAALLLLLLAVRPSAEDVARHADGAPS